MPASLGGIDLSDFTDLRISYTNAVGGSMTIGGDTCHLCGARTIETNVNTAEVGKKKNRHMVTTRYVLYACGTDVSRQDGYQDPTVEVGRKCIRPRGGN